MTDEPQPSNQFKRPILVRVRGMSAHEKYFDETAEAARISPQWVVLRMQTAVRVENEIHMTSLDNDQSGTFRVVWVNTKPRDGLVVCAVESVDGEGDLWEAQLLPLRDRNQETATQAVGLRCRECRRKGSVIFPQPDLEFMDECFLVSRLCDSCCGTTAWEIAPEGEQAESDEQEWMDEDRRLIGRAPLGMKMRVIRWEYGSPIEEICETLNVSRHGAYFLSNQRYESGEKLSVTLPYQEGQVNIEMPARVMRIDQIEGSHLRGMAIRIMDKSGS